MMTKLIKILQFYLFINYIYWKLIKMFKYKLKLNPKYLKTSVLNKIYSKLIQVSSDLMKLRNDSIIL